MTIRNASTGFDTPRFEKHDGVHGYDFNTKCSFERQYVCDKRRKSRCCSHKIIKFIRGLLPFASRMNEGLSIIMTTIDIGNNINNTIIKNIN